MSINFDFGDLEAFVAVCDAASFKRAAADLNISQSALSRRIQKLEQGLGVALIERTTRSFRLTVAATSFRAHAEQLLSSVEEAVLAVGDESDRFDYQRNSTVTVAAVPTATHKVLPRVIKRFRADGENARVRISDLSAGDVTDAVAAGEADFGITFVGAQEPGLDFKVLMDDAFILAVHRDDPLASRKSVAWAEVDAERFIAVWKGSGNRMLIDNALAKSRQTMRWSLEVRHLSTALGLVDAGLGITALPASAMPEGEHATLVAIPLVDPEVERTMGTVRRAASRLSRSSEAFYDALHVCWAAPAP